MYTEVVTFFCFFISGTFIWHNTAVGGRADYPCPYHDKVVNIKPKATRNCSVDGKWTNLDTSQCVYESRMTTMLYRHSEVSGLFLRL